MLQSFSHIFSRSKYINQYISTTSTFNRRRQMAGTKINYTAFAQFLASYPDELTLLRFRELSIRNLLFYQAELVHLARQLH